MTDEAILELSPASTPCSPGLEPFDRRGDLPIPKFVEPVETNPAVTSVLAPRHFALSILRPPSTDAATFPSPSSLSLSKRTPLSPRPSPPATSPFRSFDTLRQSRGPSSGHRKFIIWTWPCGASKFQRSPSAGRPRLHAGGPHPPRRSSAHTSSRLVRMSARVGSSTSARSRLASASSGRPRWYNAVPTPWWALGLRGATWTRRR